MEEKITSARLTDETTGKVYELDFCRESIVFAERREFNLDNALKYPVTGLRDLFYYAFRMHHRDVSREKTDKMFERWGGLPERLVNRLIALYQQAQMANAISVDEETGKNAGLTLEL